VFAHVLDGIATITIHARTSNVDSAKVVEVTLPTDLAALAVSQRRVCGLEVAQSFSRG
jgi:hypothetical protein